MKVPHTPQTEAEAQAYREAIAKEEAEQAAQDLANEIKWMAQALYSKRIESYRSSNPTSQALRTMKREAYKQAGIFFEEPKAKK